MHRERPSDMRIIIEGWLSYDTGPNWNTQRQKGLEVEGLLDPIAFALWLGAHSAL